MKKYYSIAIGLLFLLSCTTEEPTVINCSPTSVKLANNSESDYTFSEGKLTGIRSNSDTPDETVIYDYEYSGDQISRITSTDNAGNVLEYVATYSGTSLSKLTNFQSGTTTPQIELIYIYNGDKVSSYESWYGNASGTLFQMGHTAFGYDSNGNLVQSEVNFDIAAFFTLAFGSDPTSYAPQTLFVTEYVPSNSSNPLYGTYAFNNQDFSIMKNLPASIKSTDIDGNVTSESFEFDVDENGNATNATGSHGSTFGAVYTCDQ